VKVAVSAPHQGEAVPLTVVAATVPDVAGSSDTRREPCPPEKPSEPMQIPSDPNEFQHTTVIGNAEPRSKPSNGTKKRSTPEKRSRSTTPDTPQPKP